MAGSGKNFLIACGNPDLDDEGAYKSGSGNHIGNGCEVTLRATVPFAASIFRMPGPVVKMNYKFSGDLFFDSCYSEILGSRRWFVVNPPPDCESSECYRNCDSDASAQGEPESFNEILYPVSYLLPGIGMPLNAMSVVTMLLNLTMGYGSSPRYILIVPDGQCCCRNNESGQQVCNCFENGDFMRCVKRACTGPLSGCTVTDILIADFMQNHQQECNSGHFFVNQTTNRSGASGQELDTMRIEDALIELIQHVENVYRVRKPSTERVPVDF